MPNKKNDTLLNPFGEPDYEEEDFGKAEEIRKFSAREAQEEERKARLLADRANTDYFE